MELTIYENVSQNWDEGTTHCDGDGILWSGNFSGWIQHRQLIKDNACHKYDKLG